MAENYRITEKNLVAHELIGLPARVLASSDHGRVGVEGKVVDETRNLLYVQSRKGVYALPKKECTFEFRLPDENRVQVPGIRILEKPENRTKEYWKLKGR